MPPSLFAANYELKHIASEDALFKTPPRFFDDKDLLADGIGHVDASYGGGDGTAFTCARFDPNTGIMYMYGRLWQKHVDDVLDIVVADLNDKRCAPLYCEDNGDKGYLHKELQRRDVYARKYTEHQNKIVKISSFLRKWWDKIEWYENTDREYLEQILDYTENAQHDDAPDSAACLCRLLDRHAGNYVS